jgi:hypothetical protein
MIQKSFGELIINNKSFVFYIPRNECPSDYISRVLINLFDETYFIGPFN